MIEYRDYVLNAAAAIDKAVGALSAEQALKFLDEVIAHCKPMRESLAEEIEEAKDGRED